MKGELVKTSVMLAFLCLAASANAGVWFDDFSDGNLHEWEQQGSGQWEVIDGELNSRYIWGNRTPIVIVGLNAKWSSYSAKCKVKFLRQTHPDISPGSVMIGINFCSWGDFINSVELSISTNGFGTFDVSFQDKKTICDSNKQIPVKMDEWFEIKLTSVGNYIVGYVNDEKVGQLFNKPAPLSGGVSLGVFCAEARFDNVLITGNNIPNNGRAVLPQFALK